MMSAKNVLLSMCHTVLCAEVEEVLRLCGYSVYIRAAPDDAEDLFQKRKFGIAVFDASIHSPNGIRFVCELVRHRVKVLIVSPMPGIAILREMAELGLILYIEPSVDAELICRYIL